MSFELTERARAHGRRVAVIEGDGEHSYQDLLEGAAAVSTALLARRDRLDGERVAILMPRAAWFVHALWGTWLAGGVAVPLSDLHPGPELEHVIVDSAATVVLAHPTLADRAESLAAAAGARFVLHPATGERLSQSRPRPAPPTGASLILYTSGSTGRPKGVVLTHANLEAQIATLVEAWEWKASDRILHVLPLHHTHGLVNALACALWAGATCELAPRFEPAAVWQRLVTGGITLFMAVPTIYVRLLRAFAAEPAQRQAALHDAAASLRLMVSGSAPLPEDVFQRWRDITGQALLERYGMTEIGMALSNPLHHERRPGCVGTPLPGVEVRLVDEDGAVVSPGAAGELEVRGPGVFQEYWRRPDETRQCFRDGWFTTGDVAILDRGAYRILGRRSIDILKCGGYKLSALEVEAVLRTHPAVEDCAVVGLDDPDLGQQVCAAVVRKPDQPVERDELQLYARARLAPYKVPARIILVRDLPRNALGKVQKGEVASFFE